MPSVVSHGTTPTSNPTAVTPSPDQFSAVNDLSPVTKEEKEEEEEYFQNAMIHGQKIKFMVVPATSDGEDHASTQNGYSARGGGDASSVMSHHGSISITSDDGTFVRTNRTYHHPSSSLPPLSPEALATTNYNSMQACGIPPSLAKVLEHPEEGSTSPNSTASSKSLPHRRLEELFEQSKEAMLETSPMQELRKLIQNSCSVMDEEEEGHLVVTTSSLTGQSTSVPNQSSSMKHLQSIIAHSSLLAETKDSPDIKQAFANFTADAAAGLSKVVGDPKNNSSQYSYETSTDGEGSTSQNDTSTDGTASSYAPSTPLKPQYLRIEDGETKPPTPAKGHSTMQQSQSQPQQKKSMVVDATSANFIDAERHLRAIHDVAQEHLEHGEYTEALEVFEEIKAGQMERHGLEHYRVGTALHNIGIVRMRMKDYEGAVGVYDEAVYIRKKSLGVDHLDVAASLAQLGVAHLELKQYKSALVAFRDGLRIRRKFLGSKHPKVAKILNNIGCCLVEIGEMKGSMLAFQEALEIQRYNMKSNPGVLMPDDGSIIIGSGSGGNGGSGGIRNNSNQILLSIASTLCNIGSICLRWGQFDEACVALEEALLIQQSVLGDDHPTVLDTIESIDFIEFAKEQDEYNDLTVPNNALSCVNPITNGNFSISQKAQDIMANHVAPGCGGAPPVFNKVLDQMSTKQKMIVERMQESILPAGASCENDTSQWSFNNDSSWGSPDTNGTSGTDVSEALFMPLGSCENGLSSTFNIDDSSWGSPGKKAPVGADANDAYWI
uniref:Kinesin light chain n=2 Tax=Ditylum brightwellii TaxID=49249 RepID=A0A7S4S0S9_9STRA